MYMRHRSYGKKDVKKRLRFQKKNKLKNNEFAHIYGLSQNTISK